MGLGPPGVEKPPPCAAAAASASSAASERASPKSQTLTWHSVLSSRLDWEEAGQSGGGRREGGEGESWETHGLDVAVEQLPAVQVGQAGEELPHDVLLVHLLQDVAADDFRWRVSERARDGTRR